MELVDNKSQFWQGWNDFLGIKPSDSHNYIVNIIGDIIDSFKVKDRMKELGERLISDNSKSYLFHSEYVYRTYKSNDKDWLQVRLYKVDEHFIFIMYGHNAIIWCEYVGTELPLAMEKFKKYHNDGHLFLLMRMKSELELIKKTSFNKKYPDQYKLGKYRVYIFHDEYFDNLKFTLSTMEGTDNYIH